MSVPPPPEANNPAAPDSAITDQAYNLLAVASLRYVEAVSALRHLIQCAHSHGLTTRDCCRATGMDEAFVARLRDEVA